MSALFCIWVSPMFNLTYLKKLVFTLRMTDFIVGKCDGKYPDDPKYLLTKPLN